MKTDSQICRSDGKKIMRVLVDTDVLLCYVMSRGSHISAFEVVLDYAIRNQLELYVTSYAIAKLRFFLNTKEHLETSITSLCDSFAEGRIIEINSKIVDQVCTSAVETIDAALTVEAARHFNAAISQSINSNKKDKNRSANIPGNTIDAVIVLDTRSFSRANFPTWSVNELLIRLGLEDAVHYLESVPTGESSKITTIPKGFYEDLSAWFDGEIPSSKVHLIRSLIDQNPLVDRQLTRLEKLRRGFQTIEASDSDTEAVVKGVMDKIDRARTRFHFLVASGVIACLLSSVGIFQGIQGFRSLGTVAENEPELNELEVETQPQEDQEQGLTNTTPDIVAKTKTDDLKSEDISPEKSSLGEVFLFPPDASELEDSKDIADGLLQPTDAPEQAEGSADENDIKYVDPEVIPSLENASVEATEPDPIAEPGNGDEVNEKDNGVENLTPELSPVEESTEGDLDFLQERLE